MNNVKLLFYKDKSLYERPWLVIGKGPSYQLKDTINISEYNVFTLNHVIRQQKAKIAHLIDIDVFESCADEIYNNAEYLVMPYYPHTNNKAGKFSLPELINKLPKLRKIDQEKRLFWYDHLGILALRFGRLPKTIFRQIWVRRFSAEAALGILALNDVKTVFTLGVDGGSNYNTAFIAKDAHTLLSNGRNSFDDQFDNITRIIMNNNIDFQAVGTNYPIKVYVATQEEQMLSVKVLEYSIKKHTSQPVEVYPLHQSGVKYRVPNDPENQQRTPFSFQRFLIPQLNAYQGRAIYLDSDMQVFSDINKLWTLPMGGHDVLTVIPSFLERRRLQFSVMLIDCEKSEWNIDTLVDDLDSGKLNYEALMYNLDIAKNIGVSIPREWNCLEWFKQERSCLVHYTDMHTQPWVSRDNSLGHLWVADLIEGLESGDIEISLVDEHIEKGWVRPSLRYQIDHKIFCSTNLPESAKQLDKSFIAPYKHLKKNQVTAYKNQLDHIIGKLNKVVRALKQRL